jgi:hypothetical protein
VLEPQELIEDIQVGDDELILLEMRIVFNPRDPSGWAFDPIDKKRSNKIRGFKSKHV